VQQKIVERAKLMTEDDSADRLSQKAALQQEFEQLLNIFFTGGGLLEGGCCSAGWLMLLKSLNPMLIEPAADKCLLLDSWMVLRA
jgi:hypothetical protein